MTSGHVYAKLAAANGVSVDGERMQEAFKAQYRRHSLLHPAFAFNSPHLTSLPDSLVQSHLPQPYAHPAKKFWLSVILSAFAEVTPLPAYPSLS